MLRLLTAVWRGLTEDEDAARFSGSLFRYKKKMLNYQWLPPEVGLDSRLVATSFFCLLAPLRPSSNVLKLAG